MTDLKGKTALVTGGSRGIGAAIGRRLAQQGANLAITYSQSKTKAQALVEELQSLGSQAIALCADNRDGASVEAAVEEAATEFGRLDILINNAGIFEAGLITELSPEDFDRTMDVNVRAVFIACKAAAAKMESGGRIINIGSNLAHRIPWPGLSLYSMSKTALIGLSKALARDLGERFITVNLVHPGSTATDMNPLNGENAEAQLSLMAIRRYNQPDEVASLVTWLAGPESRGITGAEFTIDHGANI